MYQQKLHTFVLALPFLVIGSAYAQAETLKDAETAAIINAITEDAPASNDAAQAFSLPDNTEDDASGQIADAAEGETETIDGVEVFVLPEFEVSSEKDEGYYSAHSLAGTRTSALIKDTPMTISVINEQMMEDLNLFEMDDLAQVLAGAESLGDDDSQGIKGNSTIVCRGFKSSNQLVEFTRRITPQNGYNVGRADVIRGTNSLVYGQASPGGKVNFHAKRAELGREKTQLGVQIDNKGLRRYNSDYNKPINDELAVRVMGVDQKKDN